jgi:hypothetical protein
MSRTYRDNKRRIDLTNDSVGWGANFAIYPALYIPRYGYTKRKAMTKAKFRRPVKSMRYHKRKLFESGNINATNLSS